MESFTWKSSDTICTFDIFKDSTSAYLTITLNEDVVKVDISYFWDFFMRGMAELSDIEPESALYFSVKRRALQSVLAISKAEEIAKEIAKEIEDLRNQS